MYVDNVGTAFSLGGKVQGQSKKGKLISFVESFYGGSRIEENQELVAEIVDLAVEYNFDIDCQWIPRELNKRADASTHITAVHDFKLCAEAFEKLEDRWGIHDIDRFACPENVLVRSGLFNSRFLEPGTKNCRGIDALAQNDWHLYNNYVHPPYKMLAPAIHTIRRTRARATLVFPAWKSAIHWPMLRSPDGQQWARDVSVIYLGMSVDRRDAGRDLLIPVGEGCTRAVLPRGHQYAARFEPRVEDIPSEVLPRPRWLGRWWEPCLKRTRQASRETELHVSSKRYRRAVEVPSYQATPRR